MVMSRMPGSNRSKSRCWYSPYSMIAGLQCKTGTANAIPVGHSTDGLRSADLAADHRDEAHAASGRAAEVVGQPQLRILDLTRSSFTAELQPHLVHHAQ